MEDQDVSDSQSVHHDTDDQTSEEPQDEGNKFWPKDTNDGGHDLSHQRSKESLEDFILRLQLEDIRIMSAGLKGKQREGTKSDFQLAIEIQENEVDTLAKSIADQRMARSIYQALQNDRTILQAATEAEQTAASDRELARRLNAAGDEVQFSASASASVNVPEQSAADIAQEKNLQRIVKAQEYAIHSRTSLYDDDEYGYTSTTAESSKIASKRSKNTKATTIEEPPEQQECSACREDVALFDLASVPCTHDYCRACISRLFSDSMADESLFPPRCCRMNIVHNHVKMFLEPAVSEEFDQKKEELSATNRLYCRLPTCSAFIPSANITNDVGTCPSCTEPTCSICKGATHEGAECPEDPALAALIEHSRAAGYQRCSNCWRFVELAHGCNHITCRCGFEFCYTCGERWHTCGCDQWSQARLVQRANAILDRNGPRVPPNRAAPANNVNREAIARFDELERVTQQRLEQQRLTREREARRAEWQRREDLAEQQARDELEEDEYAVEAAHLLQQRQAERRQATLEQNARLARAQQERQEREAEAEREEQAEIAREQQAREEAATRERELNRIMTNLRENHECTHAYWNKIMGRHQCEECTHTLPEYIFECRQCQIRACWRCRRNRL